MAVQKIWLKKYTKLEHLKGILQDRQLHLAEPKSWGDWDDQNDCDLLTCIANKQRPYPILGVCCLTQARDRFHFWDYFGGREKGVCLWFCAESLQCDLGKDDTLKFHKVHYRTEDKLKDRQIDDIPFVKREQYRDEREFRILRTKENQGIPNCKFKFSSESLKRIYLNPWLDPGCVKKQKAEIAELWGENGTPLVVCQNRSLRKQSWIKAAKAISEKDNHRG